MKRFLLVFLLMLFLLNACGVQNNKESDAFTFYYLEKEFQYGQAPGMIASELRESTSQRRDLMYLMNLYLMGPTDESHIMPLPKGTRINCKAEENGSVTLELSGASRLLSDSEFTLAGTCLALTCFDITDTPEVTVCNTKSSITISRNNILLEDNHASYAQTTEETQ